MLAPDDAREYKGLEQVREALGRHDRIILAPIGTSMLPLIRNGRDSVVLVKPTFPLRLDDVALYERESGMLVLHRVVEAGTESCSLRGDYENETERGVLNSSVCALMSGVFRGDRFVSVDSFGYKVYCVLWRRASLVRRAYIFARPYWRKFVVFTRRVKRKLSRRTRS